MAPIPGKSETLGAPAMGTGESYWILPSRARRAGVMPGETVASDKD